MIRCCALLMVPLILIGSGAAGLAGQEQDEEILRAIDELFAAMAVADTERAARVLLPEGQWVSVRSGDDGAGVVAVTPHRGVLAQLGEARERWLERYWDPQVMTHGPVAVVWTPYDFHRDGQFSHCGMDAFTLVRTAEGWRIAGATYTVELTGCPESPLGPPVDR
jgi:hypothetical protein